MAEKSHADRVLLEPTKFDNKRLSHRVHFTTIVANMASWFVSTKAGARQWLADNHDKGINMMRYSQVTSKFRIHDGFVSSVKRPLPSPRTLMAELDHSQGTRSS